MALAGAIDKRIRGRNEPIKIQVYPAAGPASILISGPYAMIEEKMKSSNTEKVTCNLLFANRMITI